MDLKTNYKQIFKMKYIENARSTKYITLCNIIIYNLIIITLNFIFNYYT